MWNSCWWYDCPEAAEHYLSPEEYRLEWERKEKRMTPQEAARRLESGRTAAEIELVELQQQAMGAKGPWELPGAKLCEILAAWRAAKDEQSPGFRWMRSLRPPLHHLGSGQSAVLVGHGKPVNDAAWSPDGEMIASCADDFTLRIWDTRTGAELHRLSVPKVSDEGDLCVAFSPDGRILASGGPDGPIRSWDPQSGRQRQDLTGHAKGVCCIAFLDDSRLVSGSRDGTIRVWDVRQSEQLHSLDAHDSGVLALTVSRNAGLLASSGMDGAVRIWSTQDWTPVQTLGEASGANVAWSVSFSPDGSRLAVAYEDAAIGVWAPETGAEELQIKHLGQIRGVAFSPKGRRIAAAGTGGYVWLWDAATGQRQLPLEGHEGRIFSVAFSPVDRRLLSASGDGTVRIWDLSASLERRYLPNHGYGVQCIAVSPGGERVASSARDDTVRIWNANDGSQQCMIDKHPGWERLSLVQDLVFPSSGSKLYGQGSRCVYQWDTGTGECLGYTPEATLDRAPGSSHGSDLSRLRQVRAGVNTYIVGFRAARSHQACDGLPWTHLDIDHIGSDASGRVWAGHAYMGYYLHMFRREGLD